MAPRPAETCHATTLKAFADRLDELTQDRDGNTDGRQRRLPLWRTAFLHRRSNIGCQLDSGRQISILTAPGPKRSLCNLLGHGVSRHPRCWRSETFALRLDDRAEQPTLPVSSLRSPYRQLSVGGRRPMQLPLPPGARRSIGTLHLTAAHRQTAPP